MSCVMSGCTASKRWFWDTLLSQFLSKIEAMQFDAVAKIRQPTLSPKNRCNAVLMQSDAVGRKAHMEQALERKSTK
jgi:hypothetical protein